MTVGLSSEGRVNRIKDEGTLQAGKGAHIKVLNQEGGASEGSERKAKPKRLHL